MTRFALCVLMALICLSVPARAQSVEVATPEAVAIAFYKVAGLQPNFSAWASDTPLYHDTPVARRPKIQAQEAARLQQAYQAYSPATHLLNVATSAVVTLDESPDPENPARLLHHLDWAFTSDNSDFFPYEYRGMVFALVAQKMDGFQSAAITADQYRYIKERLGNLKRVRLVLHMRGISANGSAPVEVFGEEVWALAASVTGVTLWSADGSLVWEKSASGYVSPQTKSLNDLHQDRAAP